MHMWELEGESILKDHLISLTLAKALVKGIFVKMSSLLLTPNACVCHYKCNYVNYAY